MTPRFDLPVPAGGYAWWYLDAISDDRCHALTVIAFIGSVFSPYYAWARRRGNGLADAQNHCALNVALYAGPHSRCATAWTMTERSARWVGRDASRLSIGPSQMDWQGDALTVRIDEVTAPLPSRVRGTVRVHPAALMSQPYALDTAQRHRWCPIAPCARIEVDLQHPAQRWSGHGYLDANTGDRPLEADFSHWNWSRANLPGRRSGVLYDVVRSDGSELSLALDFDRRGDVSTFEPPPPAALPATGWRLGRQTRSETTGQPRVVQTLEDGPFYARSVVRTQLQGTPVTAVHESLSLTRWVRPVVQAMLPFRMPRRG